MSQDMFSTPKKINPLKLKLPVPSESENNKDKPAKDVTTRNKRPRDEFEGDLEIDFRQPVKKATQWWKLCLHCDERGHYSTECPDKKPLCQLDIGKSVYVVAQRFNGKMLIHIRAYEENSENKLTPTKRGIALDLEKWKKLQHWCAEDIDEAIEKYKKGGDDVDYGQHLGSNYRVTLKSGYPLVNVRRWFLPEDSKEIAPTRKGIALTFDQWEKVKDCMIVIQDIPILKEGLEAVEYCELSEDHQNQMGAMECPRCNPNGPDDIYYF